MTVEETTEAFEDLLQYLKTTRGFDFTGYKRSSLLRRVKKRMDVVEIEGHREYLDYLEVHPDEFASLFDTILINVTSFFRDPEAWKHLATNVIPRIEQNTGPTGQIRVWAAGCASGEEAYTTAIVFSEALGKEAFERRVKVYATDVDEDALATARHGVYAAKDLESVPEDLRGKYFEPMGSRFAFQKNLRRSVIFGRHDLVGDAPISRLDLLMCRNTLMYFNSELQSRIVRNFHFALGDRGFLFLGRAETLLTHGDLFAPLDLQHRLFAKIPRPARLRGVAPALGQDNATGPRESELRDAAMDAASVAQIVVDAEGVLLTANQQARNLFDVGHGDIGSPIQDLEISYRPVELRSRLDTAYAERRPVEVHNIERSYGNGDIQSFDVTIAPFFDTDGAALGVTVTFADVTRYRRLRQDLERSNQELETAYEELQSTNEELETTNEELQSTVEELETTNEELQSANEELETTNEELQSTNAEVQAVNDEIRQQGYDLNQAIAFSQSVVASVKVGVVAVDRDGLVQTWNGPAEELWGVRAEEVEGQPVVSLDIGLPVAELEDPIRGALRGDSSKLAIAARNRRGKEIVCTVWCSPLIDPSGTLKGAVLLMEQDGN